MTIDELVRLPLEETGKQLAKIAVANRKEAAMPAWVDSFISKLRAGDVGATAGLGAGAMGAYGLAREAMKPKEDRQFGNVALDATLGGALGAAGPAMMKAFSNSPPAAPPAAPSAVPRSLVEGMRPGSAPAASSLGATVDRAKSMVVDPVMNNVINPAVNWFGPQTRPAAVGGAVSGIMGLGGAMAPRGDASALRAGYDAVQSGKAQFPIPAPAGHGQPEEYVKQIQSEMGKAFGDIRRQPAFFGRRNAATANAREGLHFGTPEFDPVSGRSAMRRSYVGGSADTAADFSRRLMDVGHQQPRGRMWNLISTIPAMAGAGTSIYQALTQ